MSNMIKKAIPANTYAPCIGCMIQLMKIAREVMTATQGIGRWVQLGLGVLCMVTIANLQYGWTLFVMPLDQKYHWGRPAIQMAFTIFILAETWLVPLEGYLIDRIGPKMMVAAGGVLIGLAGVINWGEDCLFSLLVGAT